MTKVRFLIPLVGLLITYSTLSAQNKATPSYFVLRSTDCKVRGASDGKIESYEGNAWTATCVVEGTQLIVASMEAETMKPLGKESFEYGAQNGIGIATGQQGGTRYLFDFVSRKFYQGQVNIILEKGTVLTKTCWGSIVF
jgi:hypothetical protein